MTSPTISILDAMSHACRFAQDHIDDGNAWPTDEESRIQLLQCTSYQIACFLCRSTVLGEHGVDWSIVIDELSQHPSKSVKEWRKIINKKVKELGGWKC